MQSTSSEIDRLPDLEAYIDRQSALELARRSLLGAPVYAIISIIMLAGTPMLSDYGPLVISEIVLLVSLGGVRLWFALKFEQRYDRIGEQAVTQFGILTALQSLVLGVLSAMVIWHYWAVREAVLTIVLAAGCIAAGTSALSVRRSAQMIFLACVLAPFGISVFLVGGAAAAALIIGFLSLMAFLVQDGGQAKRAYVNRLKEHYGEKIARRRTELELQARKKYINEISRDIRAPVNAIVGMTALLLDETLGARAREMAQSISKSANSLSTLMGDVPGAFKPAQDVSESRFGVLDLKACIRDTMDLYRFEAAEKGLLLTTHVEEIQGSVTSCDRDQFEQVLANLMANALRNTEEGSITLSATCASQHDGTVRIEFALADTGCGIPAEKREAVFSPFCENGAKTSGKFGGDGLGLPLCKGLVDLMGGDIWIEDNDNQGTIVKFTIHAEIDPSDSAWADARDVQPRLSKSVVRPFPVMRGKLSDHHPHSILVVDDDVIHRQIVCFQLQKMGYSADEASDGEEAIAAVMQNTYDLIFMDIHMPRMNGIETTQWIRRRFNGNGPRIIALTGEATLEAQERCTRVGMDDFAAKPVPIQEIETILRQDFTGQQRRGAGVAQANLVH